MCHRERSRKYQAELPKGGTPAVGFSHCKYGHPFSPENTALYTTRSGYVSRRCRACRKRNNDARPRTPRKPRVPGEPRPKQKTAPKPHAATEAFWLKVANLDELMFIGAPKDEIPTRSGWKHERSMWTSLRQKNQHEILERYRNYV